MCLTKKEMQHTCTEGLEICMHARTDLSHSCSHMSKSLFFLLKIHFNMSLTIPNLVILISSGKEVMKEDRFFMQASLCHDTEYKAH